LYSSPNINRVIRGDIGSTCNMHGEGEKAYKILIEKSDNISLEKSRRRL
jgi:hypothetical protein